MSDTTGTLHITIDLVDNSTIVCPAGRLDFAAAPAFQHALEQAVSGGGSAPAAVIVDCGQLEYVSSAGLRAFLLGARAAKTADVRFGVCALQPIIAEVFSVSGFNKIIEQYADRDAALA